MVTAHCFASAAIAVLALVRDQYDSVRSSDLDSECRLVFSIVELRLTFESKPKQNLFLLLEGSVNPSTKTLVEDA